MPTDRRSLTSPVNGRKSTGPKTTEGKAISANNNFRHGILARNIVLDDESSERFNALANEFHQQLQPRDFVESTLVDTLVVARWRQIRLRSMEKASLSHEMRKQAPGLTTESKPTRAALAFRALSDQSRSLDLISRYDARYEHQFTGTLQRYLTLRTRASVNLPFEPTFPLVPDTPASTQTPSEQTI